VLTRLAAACARPEPFSPSDAPFWDDPHLSAQLLAAHLEPAGDAASRPAHVLRDTVQHLRREGLVLQSYGELSTFPDDVLDHLLQLVHRALVPGGHLVADVSTARQRDVAAESRSWSVQDGGFWRPGPHLLLTDHHEYPGSVWCNRYVVVTEQDVTAYRMWFRDHTPESVGAALRSAGLRVRHLWAGLDGGTYAGGGWIGVVAQRP
jgi:hypothetical protein